MELTTELVITLAAAYAGILIGVWGIIKNREASQEAREESRIEGVRTELSGRIDTLTLRMDGINTRIDTVINLLGGLRGTKPAQDA